jgi:hypothetical protein
MAPLQTLSPEKGAAVLRSDKFNGLMSLGADDTLYLYAETTGEKGRYSRFPIYENVSRFATSRIGNTTKFAIALISADTVYVSVTDSPDKLSAKSFTKLDFSGALCGKSLKPSDIFITALDGEITSTVYFEDDKGKLERFFVNFSEDAPTSFSYFPLAANFSDIKLSVAGRAAKQPANGLYAFGTYNKTQQLLYTPVHNIFGSAPPNPIRLKLPESSKPDSICVCPILDKGVTGTHLILADSKSLWLYPYDKQIDCFHSEDPDPIKIAALTAASDIKKTASIIQGGKMYVYALDANGNLSYVFASVNDRYVPSTFSPPIILKKEVYHFDISDEIMTICFKDRILTGIYNFETGSYDFEEMLIDTGLDKFSVFSAYVVKLQTDKPLSDITIKSADDNALRAYVNQEFHIFKTITVQTDTMGVLDIVQSAENLTPSEFYVKSESGSQLVSPGEMGMQKLLTLSDKRTITNAQITDMHGNLTPLLSDASRAEFAAASIAEIKQAYTYNMALKNSGRSDLLTAGAQNSVLHASRVFGSSDILDGSIWDDILYGLGEAWDYIVGFAKKFWDTTLGKVISFTSQIIGEVWHFVIKIGEEIFAFVLDTVSKVLKCVVKVLEFIGIPVSKFLDWLKSLFDIDGAVAVKDFMKAQVIGTISQFKGILAEKKPEIISVIDSAISSVEKWSDFDVSNVSSSPYIGQGVNVDSGALQLFDTIFKRGNILAFSIPLTEPPQSLISVLDRASALTKQFDVSEAQKAIINTLNGLMKVSSTDVEAILKVFKQMLGAIAVKTLNISKTLIDVIFDLLAAAADWLSDSLNAPIHIPFISSVLKFVGIEEFSILDVVLIVPAFFANTIYRIAHGGSLIKTGSVLAKSVSAFSGVTLRLRGSLSTVAGSSFLTPGSDNALTAEWNYDDYDGEEFAKLELPKDNTVEILKYCLFGVGIIELIVQAVVIARGECAKDSQITSIIGFVFSTADFSLSMISGNTYSPMSYNYYWANHWYYMLWIFKYFVSVFSCFAPILIIEKLNKKAIADRVSKTSTVVFLALSLVAAIFEIIAAVDASKVNVEIDQIKIGDHVYNLNKSNSIKDKNTYLAETSSFIFDDVRGVFDACLEFAPDKMPSLAKIAVIAVRSALGAGYPAAQMASVRILYYS